MIRVFLYDATNESIKKKKKTKNKSGFCFSQLNMYYSNPLITCYLVYSAILMI